MVIDEYMVRISSRDLNKKWIAAIIGRDHQQVLAAEMMVQHVDRFPRLAIECGHAVGDFEVAAPQVNRIERTEVGCDAASQLGEGLLGTHALQQAVHGSACLIV